MTASLDPLRFILIALSGWMSSRQSLLIDYLGEANRVLREQLGDKGQSRCFAFSLRLVAMYTAVEEIHIGPR